MLNGYMEIISTLTGIVDQMGTFVNDHIRSFEMSSTNGRMTPNQVYNYILTRLDELGDNEVTSDIRERILGSLDYKELNKMSDLMQYILKRM